MAHWIGLAQHGHDISVRNFVGEELLELVELALEGGVDLDVNGIGVLGHRADRGTRLRKRRRTGPPGRALAASPSHFSEGWFGGAPARLSALGAARGGLPGLVLAADAAREPETEKPEVKHRSRSVGSSDESSERERAGRMRGQREPS